MYILEGNIGTGKSTFLRLLQAQKPSIAISFEPISDWHTQSVGQSLLSNFYTNSSRWAYSMESFALQNRVVQHAHDQLTTEPLIAERSIYSGRYCFAANSYQNGFLSDSEWLLYQELFALLVHSRCRPPRGFIYLRADPKISYQRIKKRSRQSEESVHFDYLTDIHRQHEALLISRHIAPKELLNVPVLVLDCNRDFEDDGAVMAEFVSATTNFIAYTTE